VIGARIHTYRIEQTHTHLSGTRYNATHLIFPIVVNEWIWNYWLIIIILPNCWEYSKI